MTKTEPQAHSFSCEPETKSRFKYPINPEWQISLASESILKRCSRLTKAPITKAVIEIRANTETEWAEELITPRLKEKLSNNPNVKPERAWSQEWQFQADHEPEQRIGQ